MKYNIDRQKVLLSLEMGEKINQTFETFATHNDVKSAWVNGIGAIKNPEVGYYLVKNKSYTKKVFEGIYELTSLIGNITNKDGKPFCHTHITFSDNNFNVFGGHLFEAEIAAAGEFQLLLYNKNIDRKMNSNIGLALWCFAEND